MIPKVLLLSAAAAFLFGFAAVSVGDEWAGSDAAITTLAQEQIKDVVTTFSGSGTIIRVAAPCLLAFEADSGQTYVLENADDFWWGDRVYVTGLVNEESEVCSPYITMAIEDNTIRPYFEGPGTMVRGATPCMLLFEADTGETYVLENSGEFWWGDRVYVSGAIDEQSDVCFPHARPLIENDVVQLYFEGSGVLERDQYPFLVVFRADDGEHVFVLDDIAGFWWDDHVYVTGPVTEQTPWWWPDYLGLVEDNTIAAADLTQDEESASSPLEELSETVDPQRKTSLGSPHPTVPIQHS